MTSASRVFKRVNVAGLLTLTILVGMWEAVVRSGLLDFQYLPAPSAVADSVGPLVTSGDLAANLLHTLRSTLVGWSIASVIGVGLGMWLGLSATAWRYSMATIEVLRAIPPVSMVPLALLVFGFSLRMEISLIIYVGAWTVLVNTIDGVSGVRPELLDVARMLRMSRLTMIRRVIFPAAVPSIFVGLRLALSLSLVLAVVAEMIGNPAGLGNALVRAQQALQPEQMFAYVLTIGTVGIALNAALRYLVTGAFPSLAGGTRNENS